MSEEKSSPAMNCPVLPLGRGPFSLGLRGTVSCCPALKVREEPADYRAPVETRREIRELASMFHGAKCDGLSPNL